MDNDDESPVLDAFVSGSKMIAIFAMSIVFAMAGSYVGAFLNPMFGAVIGFFAGLLVGGVFGYFATGKYKDEDDKYAKYEKYSGIGQLLAARSDFNLYVTVDKLEDEGPNRSPVLDWVKNNDFYVRVKCGRNPVKQTSVKHNGRFGETFKLVVEPPDKSITFELTDQDIFMSDTLATVAVPVDDIYRELMETGKKYEAVLRLVSNKTRAGCLLVTFRCDDGLSMKSKFTPAHMTGVEITQGEANAPYYGTFPGAHDPHSTINYYSGDFIEQQPAGRFQQAFRGSGDIHHTAVVDPHSRTSLHGSQGSHGSHGHDRRATVV